MSKSAKVSVFEIRGEIHYAEDDVDNPINPIKYFCVSFLWPVFLPSACHYYFFIMWMQVLKENTLYFFTKPRVRAFVHAVSHMC